MNRSQIRRLLGVDEEQVLAVLTRRQHVNPHATLSEVLRATIEELQCCPDAVRRAMEWLQLDWQVAEVIDDDGVWELVCPRARRPRAENVRRTST